MNRQLSPEDIRAVLQIATPKFRAIILLAINGGFNNSDVARLELSMADPLPEVLDYPRRKTFFPRSTPLWPETREAIKAAMAERIDTEEPYVFVDQDGNPYFGRGRHCHISETFYRLLTKAGRHSPGRNFGALRTMFAEVGKELGDDVALKAAMGHSDGSQLYESYARGVYVPRLRAITDHVRAWLDLPSASNA